MTIYKTIVCLANSRKEGGHCVAGKEIINHQLTHHWIRPVSHSDTGELLEHETLLTARFPFPKLPQWVNTLIGRFMQRQSSPQVLDFITIPLLKHQPHAYQSENYLIDHRQPWIKESLSLPIQKSQWCDSVSSLWINGYHSRHGFNDRIPLHEAEKNIQSSLLLIKPQRTSIKVANELNQVKVRAELNFNQQHYKLRVTDPKIEGIYRTQPDGDYPLTGEIYLCISLSEPFHGYCYKLVASVIFLNRFA